MGPFYREACPFKRGLRRWNHYEPLLYFWKVKGKKLQVNTSTLRGSGFSRKKSYNFIKAFEK